LRRELRGRLNLPPFQGNEITVEEYETLADKGAVDIWTLTSEIPPDVTSEERSMVSFICRKTDVRRYRIPAKKREAFLLMEEAFNAIERAAAWHSSLHHRLQDGDLNLDSATIDAFAMACTRAGLAVGKIGDADVHAARSKPNRTTQKLTDPRERKIAEDVLKESLRRKRISFSVAAQNAARMLRDIYEIDVSYKTLQEKFPELDPKKRA
jgi:hypothetical protein